MSTNSINLQFLGQFRDHFQTMMVGTSTIAITECELKEAAILLWHGSLLIGMAPVSKTITQTLRLFLILIKQGYQFLPPTDSQIFGKNIAKRNSHWSN
jgi:hypothetical protein